MISFTKIFRLGLLLTTGLLMFGVTDVAIAKNNNNSGNHSEMKSGNSDHKDYDKHKDKDSHHKDKDKDKTKDANKDKDKNKDKDANKDKAPVIISGGYVRDKLPNGTVYYRRATQAELEKAAKANGGSTTASGNSGGTTSGTGGSSTTGTGGTTTSGNTPPPAAPAGDSGPVVRDHRPGGNAATYPVPGTIIRDHRNGADGKPVVVVSSGPSGTVTRTATEADLEKAGFKPKPAPTPTEVPIGLGGGGR